MLAPLLALAALSLAPLPVEPEADPFAKRDPFLKISADDLRTRWSAVEHDESDDHVSGAGASSSSRHSNSILDAAAAAARTSLNGRLAATFALGRALADDRLRELATESDLSRAAEQALEGRCGQDAWSAFDPLAAKAATLPNR